MVVGAAGAAEEVVAEVVTKMTVGPGKEMEVGEAEAVVLVA